MHNKMFSFSPDCRTIRVRVVSYPIKTEDGWGTIECKSKEITGWIEPVVDVKED
jgi:hypothetical protein